MYYVKPNETLNFRSGLASMTGRRSLPIIVHTTDIHDILGLRDINNAIINIEQAQVNAHLHNGSSLLKLIHCTCSSSSYYYINYHILSVRVCVRASVTENVCASRWPSLLLSGL